MKKKLRRAGGRLMIAMGWIIVLLSWIAALYITFVTFFTGGLLQFVNGIIELSADNIVIGFCKFLLFWIPGSVLGILGSFLGLALIVKGDDLT